MFLLGGAQPVIPPILYVYEHYSLGSSGNNVPNYILNVQKNVPSGYFHKNFLKIWASHLVGAVKNRLVYLTLILLQTFQQSHCYTITGSEGFDYTLCQCTVTVKVVCTKAGFF